VANAPNNIEHFNLVVLNLLSRLYDTFPRPLNIDGTVAIEIGFSIVPEDATNEESWDIGTMVGDIVEWLSEEGFLRYEADPNHQPGNFWKVRLTLKGLAILGCAPSSLSQAEANESLIQRVKQAIGSAASVAGKESIKQVVREIFQRALPPVFAIATSIIT
jgi:hypothetical protein